MAEKDMRRGIMRGRMALAGWRVKEVKGSKGKRKVCSLGCSQPQPVLSGWAAVQLGKTCGFLAKWGARGGRWTEEGFASQEQWFLTTGDTSTRQTCESPLAMPGAH